MRISNSFLLGLVFLISVSGLAQEDEGRSPDSIPKVSGMPNAAVSPSEKVTSLPIGMVEKVYEGTTNVEGLAQARRKIIDEAAFKVSEQLVQGILGEVRYKKYRTVISDKIFRQTSRYIPVIKAGDLIKVPEGQKLSVTLQINTKVLEALLQEQGLLFDNESAPMIIPFIGVENQVRGESYRWWKNQNPVSLQSIAEQLESQLQKALFSNNFYVQRPDAAQIRLMIPAAYQQDLLTPEQMQALASRWGIPLVVYGDLTMRQESSGDSILELRLNVIQVGTGRTLAQLYRQNKLSKKENIDALNFKKSLGFVVQAYRDLGTQLLEAWQRGVLTSTLVRLEVQGGLPLNKYEVFKEALKSSNRVIRQVRERMISAESVLFELEINGAPGDLSSGLGTLVVGDRTYRLKGTGGDNTLVLVPVSR